MRARHPAGAEQIDASGKHLLPGFAQAGSQLGLVEIDSGILPRPAPPGEGEGKEEAKKKRDEALKAVNDAIADAHAYKIAKAAKMRGLDVNPKLEAMVHQWRRAMSAGERQRLSADMQRLIADQLYWINVTGYPFFQAYLGNVKNYPFYNQAYLFLEQVWLEP